MEADREGDAFNRTGRIFFFFPQTYFIHRHGGVGWMIVDTLKVTVGFVVNLLAKVLVSFRPHLRKISLKKEEKKKDNAVTLIASIQNLYL